MHGRSRTLALIAASIASATLAVAGTSPAVQPSPPPSSSPAPTRIVGPDALTELEVWPATAAPPTGGTPPLVVVLPGWSVLASQYHELARYLTARGYAVAAFSHEPGNQDTSPEDWNLSAEGAVDYLAAEVQSPASPLHGKVDASRIGLVGHSLGGAAASLVASYDTRVKALVVFGPNSEDPTFLSPLFAVRAPVLAIDGSLDRIAPSAECSDVVVANATAADKAALVIAGGSHKNCPADFDEGFIRDSGRWMVEPVFGWPYLEWKFDWPIVPGVKPIPGAQQRATAFPYVGAWLDRYLADGHDPAGWTDGRKADDQARAGVLAREWFSAAARQGKP